MNEKSKKIFIIVLFVLLLLPMTCILGIKERTHIYGAETITSLPSLQNTSFKKREFQTQFESWWNSHFGFRKFMLKMKNTIYDFANFRVIHAGYYENIIEGENRYLFGKYIFQSVYKNCFKVPYDKLQKLKDFNNKAKRKGIRVYLVFAPSKALTYYDYLPLRYKYFLGKNCHVYENMSYEISKLGIPVYNSQPLMEKLRDESKIQPFPIGGIHWNLYGGGMAVKESFKQFGIGNIKFVGIEESRHPYLADQDLTELQNMFFRKRNDRRFYKSVLKGNFKLSGTTYVIGDSYSNQYFIPLVDAGIAKAGTIIHYENQPLNTDDVNRIKSDAKRIIFVYTDDIVDPNHQFWKKIDALLENM